MHCYICGNEIDTGKNGYSYTKNQNGITAWHFSCYSSETKEQILLSHKVKTELMKHLINLSNQGRADSWIKKVMDACNSK